VVQDQEQLREQLRKQEQLQEQLREQEQVGVVLNVRFCHELVERQKL
jgi:hypothetical protein